MRLTAAPLTSALRRALRVAVVLVVLLGVYLNVVSSRTGSLFAWTIAPEATVLFMGAAYLSAGVLVAGAARQAAWVNARIGACTAAAFTTLTSVATLLHVDRFHLSGSGGALVTAWAWMLIYTVFPVALIVLIARQIAGAEGVEPPRVHPMGSGELAPFAVLAMVAAGWGAALAIDQGAATAIWPWALSPLTAQVIGAWLVATGIGLGLVVVERDWRRVRGVIPGFTLFGLLQMLVLARRAEDIRWPSLAGWSWTSLLIAMVAAGAFGWWRSRSTPVPR